VTTVRVKPSGSVTVIEFSDTEATVPSMCGWWAGGRGLLLVAPPEESLGAVLLEVVLGLLGVSTVPSA